MKVFVVKHQLFLTGSYVRIMKANSVDEMNDLAQDEKDWSFCKTVNIDDCELDIEEIDLPEVDPNEPHFEVEYSLEHDGSSMSMHKDDLICAYVPESWVKTFDSLENAFEAISGHRSIHIWNHSDKAYFDATGKEVHEF